MSVDNHKELSKLHATGIDSHGATQELQAKAQEAYSLAMQDAYGAQVLSAKEITAGTTGILYDRSTGKIKKITFASIPWSYPSRGWCVSLKGGKNVTLRSLGILISPEVDPDQSIVVVKNDRDNVYRLVEQLERNDHLGIEQLKVLYPEL